MVKEEALGAITLQLEVEFPTFQCHTILVKSDSSGTCNISKPRHNCKQCGKTALMENTKNPFKVPLHAYERLCYSLFIFMHMSMNMSKISLKVKKMETLVQ